MAHRALPLHFERSANLPATCAVAFDYLDDFESLGEHMQRANAMTFGMRMRYEFDDTRGRATGAAVRISGSMLGIAVRIAERVTERVRPTFKYWETEGAQRMLALDGYRMGFELAPAADGSRLTVFIDYALPARGFGRVLGIALGGIYARWCVRNMIEAAVTRFGRDAARPADGHGDSTLRTLGGSK